MPASTAKNNTPFQSSALGGVVPPVFGPTYLGNVWFVDPVNGSDGNVGTQPKQAFATLAHALLSVVAGNNDVIMFSGTVHLTATLAWNVNNTHLIGCNPPGQIAQRARISSSGAAAISPLVQVTGNGCYFANFEVFNGIGAGTTQICWQESSQRNVYDSVDFQAFGSTQAAGATGTNALLIDGGAGQPSPTTGLGEFYFRRCGFGADTIQRGVANSSLVIENGSPRNIFEDCIFTMNASAATPLHLSLGASSIDRFVLFNGCIFINETKSGATTINQNFSVNASPGGLVLLKACISVGATKWETSPSNNVFLDMPAPSASAGGYAINNT